MALLTLPVALVIAPPDAVQGEAQRWMYLHVPAAWSAYAAFAVVLVMSLQVLLTGRSRPAVTARAAAETGLVLTVLTLATGSIWGKLTWGVWWAADARILTTVALGCGYAAYLAVVQLTSGRSPRIAAVVGVVGFAMVPVVHLSVVWWRTLHQPPTILAPQSGLPIEPLMGLALGLSVLAFSLATAGVVLTRSATLSPASRTVPGTGNARPRPAAQPVGTTGTAQPTAALTAPREGAGV